MFGTLLWLENHSPHIGLSSALVNLQVDTFEVCSLLCFQDLLLLKAHTRTLITLQSFLNVFSVSSCSTDTVHLLPSCNCIVMLSW